MGPINPSISYVRMLKLLVLKAFCPKGFSLTQHSLPGLDRRSE